MSEGKKEEKNFWGAICVLMTILMPFVVVFNINKILNDFTNLMWMATLGTLVFAIVAFLVSQYLIWGFVYDIPDNIRTVWNMYKRHSRRQKHE